MEFNPVSLKNEWFHVPIGIFHHNVYAFVGSLEGMRDSAKGKVFEKFGCSCEESDAIRAHIYGFCESHKGQNDAGDAFGRDNFSIIRVADMTTGNIDHIAILGHECLHVATGLIDYLGIQESPNKELLCYTHEYIFRELLEHMCECGLGKRCEKDEKPEKPDAGDKGQSDDAPASGPQFKPEPAVPPSAPGCARALTLTHEDRRLLKECAKKAATSLKAHSIDIDAVLMRVDAFFVEITCRDSDKIEGDILQKTFRTMLIAELESCGVVAGEVLLLDGPTLKVVPPPRKAPEDERKSQTLQPLDAPGFRILTQSTSDWDMLRKMATQAAKEANIGHDAYVRLAKKDMPEYLFDILVKANGQRYFEDFEKHMQELLIKEGYCTISSRHDVVYDSEEDVSRAMVALGNSIFTANR